MENPTTFKEYLDYLYRIGRRTAIDVDPERVTAVMTDVEQIKMAGLLLKCEMSEVDISNSMLKMLINDCAETREEFLTEIKRFHVEHYKQEMDDLLKNYNYEELDGA